jgi:hypothetical protein
VGNGRPRFGETSGVTTSQPPDNRPTTPPPSYHQPQGQVPPQWGPPQQNWAPQPPAPAPKNGLGTTALVLGILGALFSLIPFIGVIAWPLVILGLIFGIVGFFRARSGKATNRGVAIAGTILSLIGLIMCIVYASAFTSAVANSTAPSAAAPVGAAPAVSGQDSSTAPGKPGDTLTTGDLQLTAAPLTSKTPQFMGPMKCAEVSYRNTGSGQASYNAFDWKLQNPAGAIVSPSFGGDNSLSSGQLAPGGTTSGQVCFDAKDAQSGSYTLSYEGGPFTDKVSWVN